MSSLGCISCFKSSPAAEEVVRLNVTVNEVLFGLFADCLNSRELGIININIDMRIAAI